MLPIINLIECFRKVNKASKDMTTVVSVIFHNFFHSISTVTCRMARLRNKLMFITGINY
jgi:hypothetical protein